MAFLAAPVAMKVGKSALNFACTEGVQKISAFVKDTIHQHMDKVCSPDFPPFLVTTLLGMMKENRYFPRQIREFLESRRDILDNFVRDLIMDPKFKEACATKKYEMIDGIVDQKAAQLKERIMICPKEGGRGKKKTRRVRKSKSRKSFRKLIK